MTKSKKTTDTQVEPSAKAPMHRACGYLPDTEEERASHKSHLTLVGAPARVPEEAMGLEALVGEPLNQFYTSACVGEAIAKAVNTRLAAQGTPAPPFSGLGLYTLGRELGRHDAGDPILDSGSNPSTVIRAAAEWGIPFESSWPLDVDAHPERINRDLPVDVLEDAITHEVKATYRINSYGADRLTAIRTAIAQGYPIVFGTRVSDDFQAYAGGTLDPETKPGGGGHMLCLIGYSGNRFRGINSWGTSWGECGLFWCSEAFLKDARADDFYVVTAGPRG